MKYQPGDLIKLDFKKLYPKGCTPFIAVVDRCFPLTVHYRVLTKIEYLVPGKIYSCDIYHTKKYKIRLK